jgi:hypothetical protein
MDRRHRVASSRGRVTQQEIFRSLILNSKNAWIAVGIFIVVYFTFLTELPDADVETTGSLLFLF